EGRDHADHEGADHDRDHAEGHDHTAHDHDHAAGHAAHAGSEGRDHAAHEDADHDHDHLEPLHVHDEGLKHVRVARELDGVITVVPGELHARTWAPSLRIPGETRVATDKVAELSAPVAVRLLSLDHPEHASVRPGERLGVLELVDPSVRELQMRAVEARAERMRVRTELDRSRAYLAALGGADAQERRRVEADGKVLEAGLAAAESTLSAVLAGLELAGLTEGQRRALEERGEVATQVEVRAPHIGSAARLELRTVAVHQGETVGAGSTLFELVALDPLLVVGEALEGDVSAVREAVRAGLPVTVRFPDGAPAAEGLTVHAVEGALHDPTQRVTRFFVHLPNTIRSEHVDGAHRFADWEYRAGARVEIAVARAAPRPAFVLPWSAVVQEGVAGWVFRQESDGGWVRMPVQLVEQEVGEVVVAGKDLREGDTLAMDGATQLQMLLAAGGADPHFGHNHNH
ncbi:MAG: efflux RND transporter periplasmic adaptor subunit, partial [Deltaproteobacteria bacterium]|nr:efflux RND transporter periplasmic adaptor subunit [Deltaproteobacteria bacterium]